MPELKIARIETFLFDPGTAKNLLFCRVETEDGLHGWGEAYVTPGKEPVIEQCLQVMAKYMIGRSAFNIRHTGQILFDDFAIRRASLDLLSAWSALEIAMWDIVAKHAGLPLYNMLGGASRERVHVYANGWSNGSESIEANIERALKVKEMGFTALKWDPFPGPWRSFIHREDEDHVVRYVRAMREALGPDFALLVEVHRRLAPMHAIRIGKRIAEFDIGWYEEPCLCDNIELVAEVRRALPIPIVTGEAIYSKEAFAAGAGGACGRHPQSGHLQLRRHLRDAGHRGDGAAARRGDRAAQLQLHAGRAGGDGAVFRGDSELLDRRVLRQPEAGVRRDGGAAAHGEGRLGRAADDAGARHRHRRGAAEGAAVPRHGRQGAAAVLGGVSAEELRGWRDADGVLRPRRCGSAWRIPTSPAGLSSGRACAVAARVPHRCRTRPAMRG